MSGGEQRRYLVDSYRYLDGAIIELNFAIYSVLEMVFLLVFGAQWKFKYVQLSFPNVYTIITQEKILG